MYRQISRTISRPGMPVTKNPQRQPNRDAIWVVRIGAANRPTSAAPLVTMPTLRPRRERAEDSSSNALMATQHGPSAKPIRARITSNSWKLRAKPESHEKVEKIRTAGIRILRRPKRSEAAPKSSEPIAQAIETTEARK